MQDYMEGKKRMTLVCPVEVSGVMFLLYFQDLFHGILLMVINV